VVFGALFSGLPERSGTHFSIKGILQFTLLRYNPCSNSSHSKKTIHWNCVGKRLGNGKKLKQSIEIKAFIMPCDEMMKIMEAKYCARGSEKVKL